MTEHQKSLPLHKNCGGQIQSFDDYGKKHYCCNKCNIWAKTITRLQELGEPIHLV